MIGSFRQLKGVEERRKGGEGKGGEERGREGKGGEERGREGRGDSALWSYCTPSNIRTYKSKYIYRHSQTSMCNTHMRTHCGILQISCQTSSCLPASLPAGTPFPSSQPAQETGRSSHKTHSGPQTSP